MIRHTILFKAKITVSQQAIDTAINAMCALKNKLPGILSIIAGECHFLDEKSTDFFIRDASHAISIDFKDRKALDQFFHDAITHPAKDSIVAIAERGYKGIVGFDLEG